MKEETIKKGEALLRKKERLEKDIASIESSLSSSSLGVKISIKINNSPTIYTWESEESEAFIVNGYIGVLKQKLWHVNLMIDKLED